MRNPMRSGYALIGILWFAAFFFTITVASLGLLEGARGRVEAHKRAQAAAAMAVSGADWAEAMIHTGRWEATRPSNVPGWTWTPRHEGGHVRWVPTGAVSPDLDGGGTFAVAVARLPNGGWHISSVGRFGAATQHVERTIR